MPTIWPRSFHSRALTCPGRGLPRSAARFAAPLISDQRIALTWSPVGAVVMTTAVPGGWESIHHVAALEATQLLPMPWHDLTAVNGLSRTDWRISTCLDHTYSPSRSRTHSSGWAAYRSASGSGRVLASSSSATADSSASKPSSKPRRSTAGLLLHGAQVPLLLAAQT